MRPEILQALERATADLKFRSRPLQYQVTVENFRPLRDTSGNPPVPGHGEEFPAAKRCIRKSSRHWNGLLLI
ncbi:MAG TPA: hypothetical protein DCZ91_25970 [Lachnospiraceae bacterium]|nr:hypothetical protein [Lachnospiraceae bacterium]